MIFNDMNLVSGSSVAEKIIVVITGRNTALPYDGQSHSVNNYTVAISDPSYTINDFTFSGTATASGTNVGKYSMGLEAEQFVNTNPKFRDVEFQVTDGFIRITPKYVTVTADNKNKIYDGDPTTDPTFTATVVGLIGSDTIEYSLSCIHEQNVLYSGNEVAGYTITPSGSTSQGNYSISYSTGKFTINPASVTLTANSGRVTYNGSVQSISGFESSVLGLVFNGVTASGSGTNVNSYPVTFSGVVLNSTKDTTGNYVVTSTINGSLTINKASASDLGLSIIDFNGEYTGNPCSLIATTTVVSGTIISYSIDVSTWSTTPITRTDRGTTTVYVKAENDNYYTALGTGTITITKGSASSLGLTVTSYVGPYDGSAHTLTATTTVTIGTTISYSLDNVTWSETAPTRRDMGTTTVYVKAENDNYETATATGTISIGKKSADELGLTVPNYDGVYDGYQHRVVATVRITSGTTITYSTDNINWSRSVPSRVDVGTTTVYVRAQNDQYETATATGYITITKAPAGNLGLTVTDYSGYYDRYEHTITARVSVSSGTTIEYRSGSSSWSTTPPSRINVGTTTVYVRATNANYETATTTGYITIIARPTTGNITVNMSFNDYALIELHWDPFGDDTIVYSRTIANGTTIRNLTPGFYSVSNETQGLYSFATVTAGETVTVTV